MRDMKGHKLFHICNLSPKVIFRCEEDFLMAINKLAACAYTTNIEILAFCIMSTHFHIVAKSSTNADISSFITLFKRNITRRHNNKYKASIKISISKRELENYFEVITAINYVLKNPVHHNIVELPFKYAYSSISCYFSSELTRSEYFRGEKLPIKYTSPCKLGSRDYKYLFGSHKVPDNFLLLSKRVVIPQSFVKIDHVQTIYSNAKTFLYNMSKPLAEEIEMFGDNIKSRNNHLNKVTLAGKLTDLEVCELFDAFISPKTYTQLSENEVTVLWNRLRKLGVDSVQYARVIG